MRQTNFEGLSEKNIEGSYKLPEGWRWVRLGDVVEPIMGQSPPSSTYNQEGIGLPFYQGKIDFGELYPTPRVWCNKPNKIAEPNDILISVRAPVGPVNICKEKSCIGRGLAALRPINNTIFYLFLFYYLKSVEKNWTDTGKGSTFQAVRKRDLQGLPIPLPPLPEQRRIVARIEELFNKIDKIRRLRKEALKQAKTLMSAALYEVFSKADEKGWRWVRLGEVATNIQSGFACSKKYEIDDGIPHLRPNNIGFDGELDLSKLVHIPEEMVDLTKYSLKKEDVLFNNTNSKELVGRACLVKENLSYGFSNHITRLRADKNLITSEWMVLAINYLWLQGYFLKICQKWIGQAGVNTKMLKSTYIPLPPLPEQRRIVAHLYSIQKKVAVLQKLQEETEKEAEKLRESILYKAFRGEF